MRRKEVFILAFFGWGFAVGTRAAFDPYFQSWWASHYPMVLGLAPAVVVAAFLLDYRFWRLERALERGGRPPAP